MVQQYTYLHANVHCIKKAHHCTLGSVQQLQLLTAKLHSKQAILVNRI